MATLCKDSIHFFSVTDLTQVELCVRYLPVADSLTMTFAVLESANILITRGALNICALSMADIFNPVTVVRITRGIDQFALTMASTKDKVTLVDHTGAGYVCSFAMLMTLHEVTAVVVLSECGLNGLVTGETVNWMAARMGPQILDETIRTGE